MPGNLAWVTHPLPSASHWTSRTGSFTGQKKKMAPATANQKAARRRSFICGHAAPAPSTIATGKVDGGVRRCGTKRVRGYRLPSRPEQLRRRAEEKRAQA